MAAGARQGSRGGRSPRRMMNEINVVPYIDVMLVLLVIFMVAAPLVNPGVIDLPSVGKSSQPPAKPLEVMIQADGALSVRDRAKDETEPRPVSRDQLAEFIKARQAALPDQPVVISADRNVKYDAVLQVMDELQKREVRRVGLTVKPAP
jgi:biopolymer transport protein TolR